MHWWVPWCAFYYHENSVTLNQHLMLWVLPDMHRLNECKIDFSSWLDALRPIVCQRFWTRKSGWVLYLIKQRNCLTVRPVFKQVGWIGQRKNPESPSGGSRIRWFGTFEAGGSSRNILVEGAGADPSSVYSKPRSESPHRAGSPTWSNQTEPFDAAWRGDTTW